MGDPLKKLQILGAYGLRVKKSYPALSFPSPDGYTYSLRTGDSRGLKTWSLNYELHDDPQLNSYLFAYDEDGTLITPKQYIVRFFDEQHDPEIRPFILTCPDDDKDYTAIFTTHSREMVFNDYKMWATGLEISQIRLGDMGLGELGEVSQINPQQL
ncbi:MAG: hypothetical protein ABI977_03910 [Acidobacteriota bacterium]